MPGLRTGDRTLRRRARSQSIRRSGWVFVKGRRTGTRGYGLPSELPAEHAHGRLGGAAPRAAALPPLEGDLLRALHVDLELLGEQGREMTVPDAERDLVVKLERAV